jgi:chromosome partitioning protein
MAVVCLVNRKGGVGKTTLTLALADFLSAIHGRSILVIDVDPQATASLALLGEERWKETDDSRLTVADLFESAVKQLMPSKAKDPGAFIQEAPRIQGASGLVHVVASSPRLHEVGENALEAFASWSPYAGSPYLILHQSLHAHVSKGYDYVLIDCPPSTGMITLNALAMSSGYLIPTMADYISTVGLAQLTERVKAHATGLRRKIPFYGTVVNQFRQPSRSNTVILAELRRRKEAQPVWDTVIPDSMHARAALHQDAGVMTLKARYGGGLHSLYASLEALAAEFLQRVF